MKNKQKVKALLRRLKEKAHEWDDNEAKELCQEAEDAVEAEDDGSNPGGDPPPDPPGKKP